MWGGLCISFSVQARSDPRNRRDYRLFFLLVFPPSAILLLYNYIIQIKSCQLHARFFALFLKKSCYVAQTCDIMIYVKISFVAERKK